MLLNIIIEDNRLWFCFVIARQKKYHPFKILREMIVLAKSITQNKKTWGKLFPIFKEYIHPPAGELNRDRLVHPSKPIVRYIDKVMFDSRFSLTEILADIQGKSHQK